MKYLPFIFRNLFRKKTRTILTIGSIAVALFPVSYTHLTLPTN